MTLTRDRLLTLLILGILLLALPAAIFLTRKKQDIRPRALMGAANFHLNADKTSVNTGDTINVTSSLEVTNNASAKVSGVDFTLLYDRNKLKVVAVNPTLGTNFTDVPVNLNQGMPYPAEGGGNYYSIRVAMVSKNANASLPSGTIPLASISFQALATGQAIIKYPDDNNVLQVVGSSAYPDPAGS